MPLKVPVAHKDAQAGTGEQHAQRIGKELVEMVEDVEQPCAQYAGDQYDDDKVADDFLRRTRESPFT
jgi:hypothetical protein